MVVITLEFLLSTSCQVPFHLDIDLIDCYDIYTLGKCILRLRTLSASSEVNLYTPASCNAAQAGEMPSLSLMLPSEDLSKSLSNTADPGRRFNKMQASLTLKKIYTKAVIFKSDLPMQSHFFLLPTKK